MSFDSLDHASRALSPPPCIVAHAVCSLCRPFKLGRFSTSRPTTVRNSNNFEPSINPPISVKRNAPNVALHVVCRSTLVFTDDFAYDRSHNVRPRRNIRQVCAMTHIRLLTPHPCLAHRRMVLLSCSQAMQHGTRFSRLPYRSDTESHTTPLQTAHFCPQFASFSQKFRCML